MNRFAYRLLQQGRTTAAVDLFELNVESAPEWANAYDSLGEGYWNQGRFEDALASYEKSVALDPQNENGHRMIGIIREKLSGDTEDQ